VGALLLKSPEPTQLSGAVPKLRHRDCGNCLRLLFVFLVLDGHIYFTSHPFFLLSWQAQMTAEENHPAHNSSDASHRLVPLSAYHYFHPMRILYACSYVPFLSHAFCFYQPHPGSPSRPPAPPTRAGDVGKSGWTLKRFRPCTQGGEAMDAAMRIGSGGHQRATVQAVILCGGFGGDLVNDVLHEIGSVRDTRRANYYRSLLDGGPGEEHITEALVPVHRASALYHLLLSMESSRRLHPLDRNVFVVCNEANRGRFMQEETGFSDRAWSSGGMRLRRENVISNHASAPAEWAGEGGDLQAALRSGLLDPGADLLVVRGSMLLLPDYNFSRVVEHALVHSCNCVAYAQACGRRADLMRWRPSPPFVLEVEKPGSSSSRIAQASRRAPREGEYGAVGLALLKAAEIQQAALGAVEDAWLEEVALRPLMDGRCASGIDLQAGHFSVATLAGWSYADALFDTYAFTLCDRPPRETRPRIPPVAGGTGECLGASGLSGIPPIPFRDSGKRGLRVDFSPRRIQGTGQALGQIRQRVVPRLWGRHHRARAPRGRAPPSRTVQAVGPGMSTGMEATCLEVACFPHIGLSQLICEAVCDFCRPI